MASRCSLVIVSILALSILALSPAADLEAQRASPGAGAADPTIPALAPIVGFTESGMREVVERWEEDRNALRRRWSLPYSAARAERMRRFQVGWHDALRSLDYGSLGVEDRIDWLLLDNEIRYALARLDREERQLHEMRGLLPFVEDVAVRVEAWRRFEPVDPEAAARELVALAATVEATHERVDERGPGMPDSVTAAVALRAAGAVDGLLGALEDWYEFYADYDPLFTWWVAEPWAQVEEAFDAYEGFLRDDLAGLGGDGGGEDEPIVGDPIGAEGLRDDLVHEMIPYTPAELVAIAEREFAWVEREMRRAAADMGHGDDWRAALEEVKTLHVPPGEQPELVRMLAQEAVDFVKAHDLVTIPPLAEEIWRWSMLSAARQEVSPFFLGGERIQISYPTAGMEHEDKLMSMRGNNIHFSRATVHHELIPGHHLQGFMTDRYNPHRALFSTPFWGEGWALYWEMLLWDMEFPGTPEDRMGMLFWRAHRAARIIFSLGFHLGTMTPEEAIDFLVERVGHEPANAEAEVRRSFTGQYPPLYQAAYMLGGLQIRALREELVESGRMSDRQFHDAILEGGRMPIEMVRARLLGTELPRDFTPGWRFAGDPE